MFNFRKWKWGHWTIAVLLLLAFCDSDSNDKDDDHCYMFGEKQICFAEPLPEDKYCHLMDDEQVRCFDQPRSLGNREFGSSVALPIWLSFTKEIIDQIPLKTSLPPEGLSIIKIDKSTGKRANVDTQSSIFEYFLEENLPN